MDSKKIVALLDTSDRCWQGRVGENETLHLVEQFAEGWSERELQFALSMLLNRISIHSRQALARQCPHFDPMQNICK